jgi:hypothetical protein
MYGVLTTSRRDLCSAVDKFEDISNNHLFLVSKVKVGRQSIL